MHFSYLSYPAVSQPDNKFIHKAVQINNRNNFFILFASFTYLKIAELYIFSIAYYQVKK